MTCRECTVQFGDSSTLRAKFLTEDYPNELYLRVPLNTRCYNIHLFAFGATMYYTVVQVMHKIVHIHSGVQPRFGLFLISPSQWFVLLVVYVTSFCVVDPSVRRLNAIKKEPK